MASMNFPILLFKKEQFLTCRSSQTSNLALHAMNAGDGPLSYALNSSYQRGVVNVATPIIEEEIATKLDIKHLLSSSRSNSAFCIADFGSSTGHNSFPAMHIIIQAIKQKLLNDNIPEFYVFFNDLVTNDFNTLFSSLPADGDYSAAGVPGDFHGRLLPESSLHFAYSSWSLQWLSEVPKAVAQRGSPAWNSGKILYEGARKEVCEAYLDQFGKDMESFLESRAVEMVSGGLMVVIVPGVPPYWNSQTEYTIPSDVNLLGSCLVDMAKKGRLSEAKIESFNLPYYFATPEELKVMLERNQSFSMERMEILNNPGKYSLPSVHARATFFRAVHERLLKVHFGSEIIDELFDLYMKKLASSPVFLNPQNDRSIVILAVLKRKTD